ncbi:MAG: TatD family hydrolase [Candidatus Xenobiia bacterium LiM19]
MPVDSHAHLQMKAFNDDYSDVISRAIQAGIEFIIVPGSDIPSSKKALEMHGLDRHIIPAVGIHPHDAKKASESAFSELEELASEQSVVAVGEIGLDFHYNFSPPEIQIAVLREQIQMAHRVGKPLILHSRESQHELLAILREEEGEKCGGVIHCFSGTVKEAEDLLKLGFYIGFTGIVTYKSAVELKKVAQAVPLERMLVETDAPYLTPNPHRGERNEPGFIPLIVDELARIRKTSADELGRALLDNTRRLFSIDR